MRMLLRLFHLLEKKQQQKKTYVLVAKVEHAQSIIPVQL